MGCCISKCRPDQHPLPPPEFNHVRHKLVVPISNKTPPPPSPPSPPSPTSSFACPVFSNTSISSASSLSSASSSSALTSRDGSFSNDFLWSCYKDNPHIVRIHSLKEASLSSVPTKAQINKTNPSNPPQKSVGPPVPLKRVRSSSPANLARQKSFRKEPERPSSPCNVPSRKLRSPSPSRRFNGGIDNLSKRIMSPKANYEAHSQSVSSSMRREKRRAASPTGLRRRENCGFKIEETVVKDVGSKHEVESGLGMTEDIHNPLISLDCFIFL
ncbi:formin-like protein 6 [Prosopis cineraria]|uniref:formin-like protein 6 n=1 Tax=Prosopis cineraria TaxID=364024 RepID=UPI00240F6A2E|nr:formin-like protein 6 [Prosopis cineraria]